MVEFQPIGYFRSLQTEKYMAPRQADLAVVPHGEVILSPGCNFEEALRDLEGFSRIWILFWFHKNSSWRPKVQTPRCSSKKGVFATRSPHRPNPIGLSSVELLKVQGRTLFVGKCDLIDGTPIFDIKPYLAYADAFLDVQHGWLDQEEVKCYTTVWSEKALLQAAYIENESGFSMKSAVDVRLQENPFPFPNHRIKQRAENSYELAVKSFRVHYTIQESSVFINEIVSGYDQETIEGKKVSRFDDVQFHRKFLERFSRPKVGS